MGEQRHGAENRKIQACGSNTRLATVGSFWGEPTWAVLEKKVIKWTQLNSKLWVLNSMGQNKNSVFVSQTDIAESHNSLSLVLMNLSHPLILAWCPRSYHFFLFSALLQCFTVTVSPDTSLSLVHTLSNQPCSISFIPTFFQLSDIFGFNLS